MTTAGLSAVQLALAAQSARDAMRDDGDASLLASEPIAIIGMACRFPGGADDPEQLWTLLDNGVNAVTRVPTTRWDASVITDDPTHDGKLLTPYAGLLHDIEGFDADFFGIAPREAVRMDPQQRLLLEVTWDALRDAGCTTESLRGSPTGVFAAIYSDDYARNLYGDWDAIDAHTASGNSHGVSAGRIAYLLDLRGPAIAVDTACSSSLVAVHTACRSLRTGETSLAIVGAASLLIAPEQTASLTKWGMMAPDGRTKAFDAGADGWVRSEGAGALVLKRLADALGDGDRVLAVIRGTAVNQDGRSAALTAPNGLAQRAVVRDALENARIPASRVTFVEAHGTGTSVGDPIELEALIAEIGGAPGAPCHVGTVKANLGHLEAAAGVAGMIKVVQSLRHERIPPHINFSTLNPLVSLDGTRLRIASGGADWPQTREPRVAGVSSFGFGGTNAHVVVEEAPRIPATGAPDDGPWLVTVSAHDPVALREMADDVSRVARTHGLRDVAWTLATHDALRYRVAVVAESAESLGASMRDAIGTDPVPVGGEREVGFVFSGHGSQWAGMGRESMAHDEVFARSMERSDAIVRAYAGWSPLDVLRNDSLVSRLDDTDVFQPVLVAVQLAQAASWIASGRRPVAVLGHSVGELAAACVAGALTATQALEIAVDRGRLMQETAGDGAMLAAQGDESIIRRIAASTEGIVVSGENAPGMLTLSGAVETIGRCRNALEHAGVVCHQVRVARAFHSPAMLTAATQLAERWATLESRVPSIPFYSSVTGARVVGTALDAQYWELNAREPVRFGAASAALLAAHECALIEIAPHPVLVAPLRATLGARVALQPVVPTWRRNQGELATTRASQGVLWCAGVATDRERLFSVPGERISLPPYRWQRRRAWAGAPLPLGRMAQGDRSHESMPGRLTEVPALQTMVFESIVRADDEIVREHRVSDRAVVPGAMLLLAALSAAERSRHLLPAAGDDALSLHDVMLDRALSIDDGQARTVQVTVRIDSDGTLVFTITSRAEGAHAGSSWERHAAGRIAHVAPQPFTVDVSAAQARCTQTVDTATIYDALERGGIALGPSFRLLRALHEANGEAVSELTAADVAQPTLAQTAARLDAALHGLGQLAMSGDDAMWLPVSYESVSFTAPQRIASSVLVMRTGDANADTRVADAQLFDDSGIMIGAVLGVRVQRTSRQALARGASAVDGGDVYTMHWDAGGAVTNAPRMSGERWLVLEDAQGNDTPIADAIEAAGGSAIRIAPLRDASTMSDAEFDAALHAMFSRDGISSSAGFDGVVFGWGLGGAPDVVPLTGSALVLLRALVTHGVAPRHGVLLLTCGAVQVGGDAALGSVASAALWGLRHTAAAEHPELSLRSVDLTHFSSIADNVAMVLQECHADAIEPRVARRGAERFVARLDHLPQPTIPGEHETLAILPPSDALLESLAPVVVPRRAPAPGMVEIAVRAAGLNFRDVLGALGMVTLPINALGGECAGVVRAVGEGVQGVSVGDRVVAFVLGALRTHVHVEADLVAPMPEWMTFEHASALPVAYLTAYHALVRVANVQPGERVLVHAAAGGVGIAAVCVAHWRGAHVVGTAGSGEKRAFLRSLGVGDVFDSRAVTFRDALRAPDGRGSIDVVLNSLSEEFIPASLDALAPGGRFVEIGKRGIWSAEDVAARRGDVAYSVFDLSTLAPDAAAGLGAMLREIMQLVRTAALPPLPTVTFPFDACASAFRFMAQARHTGKIAIVMPASSDVLRTDGTYFVTGAFGALGRGVIARLAADGVRSFALLARRAPDDDGAAWLDSLTSRGVTCTMFSVDVGDRDSLAAALAEVRRDMLPLRGVVHTAGVNDDGALVSQNVERLRGVMRGKVDGAMHLDALTRDDALDTFLLFSSASGVIGWPGQASYAAANAALDQVAALRRASGRRAVSLQWGTWDGGGMATRVAARARRFDATGIMAFTPAEALDLMMTHRTSVHDRMMLIRADWRAFVAARPADARLYTRLPTASVAPIAPHVTDTRARVASLLDRVAALPDSLRPDAVRDAVMTFAARMLGLPSGARLDATRPLRDLGLDSLMAVELQTAIGAAVERTLPATLLFEHPTVDALSAYVLALLQPSTVTARTAAAPRADSEPTVTVDSDVAAMSDDDAEAMLLAELAVSRTAPPRQPRS
ncbi:MAG: type I polyketide synthase [Gemmatimonadaceae bacterium]|nr:type I polyketide synthase [Gemmatimonadaceae bacterium]